MIQCYGSGSAYRLVRIGNEELNSGRRGDSRYESPGQDLVVLVPPVDHQPLIQRPAMNEIGSAGHRFEKLKEAHNSTLSTADIISRILVHQ